MKFVPLNRARHESNFYGDVRKNTCKSIEFRAPVIYGRTVKKKKTGNSAYNRSSVLKNYPFSQMNGLVRMAAVAVFVFLQLFACSAAKLPARPNKPSKTAAQRRDGGGSGYVDFGAHTGPLGSYGWYADFPANRS